MKPGEKDEAAIAEAARATLQVLDEHKEELKHLPTLRQQVEAIAKKLDLAVDDHRKLLERVESNHAANEKMARIIRNRQDGLYVAGLEDRKVNLAKVIFALACGTKAGRKLDEGLFKQCDASEEFETLMQVQKKHGHQWLGAKAQNIADDELGGAFVPGQVLENQLILPLYRDSVLIGLENGQTRVTVLDNIATLGEISIPHFVGGSAAGWLGEQQIGAQTQVKTGMKVMRPRKAGCWLPMTEEIIRGAAYGFTNLLEMDLRHALADLLDEAVMYGMGSEHQPRGILKTAGLRVFSAGTGLDYADVATANSTITDWAGGELELRKMMQMQLALKRAKVRTANAAWISSPDFITRTKARQLKQFTGQTDEKAFQLGPFLRDETLRSLIGDFAETPFVPYQNKPGASIGGATTSVVTKFTDVLYGNLQQVMVALWGGLEIATDDGKGLGFPSEVTLVRARMRADVGVRRPDELIVCPDAQALD